MELPRFDNGIEGGALAAQDMQQKLGFSDIFQRASQIKLARDQFEQVTKPATTANIAMTMAATKQQQNENQLWQMKNQAHQFESQAAADAATAQATQADQQVKLAATKMALESLTAPQNPDGASGTSELDRRISDLSSVPVKDIAQFQSKLAEFNAWSAPLAAASPAFGQAVGLRLSPIAGARDAYVAGAKTNASLWAAANVFSVNGAKDMNELDQIRQGGGTDFAHAMFFDPEFKKTVMAKQEKLQEQAQELKKQEIQRNEEFRLGQEKLNRETSVENDEFGISGYAPNTTASEKARSTLTSLGTLKDAMQGLYSVARSVANSPAEARLDPKVAAEALVKKQQLVAALGQLQAGGYAAPAETIDELNKLIPVGTDIGKLIDVLRGGQGTKLLSTLDSLAREAHTRMLSVAGTNNLKVKDRSTNQFSGEQRQYKPGDQIDLGGGKTARVFKHTSGQIGYQDPANPRKFILLTQ